MSAGELFDATRGIQGDIGWRHGYGPSPGKLQQRAQSRLFQPSSINSQNITSRSNREKGMLTKSHLQTMSKSMELEALHLLTSSAASGAKSIHQCRPSIRSERKPPKEDLLPPNAGPTARFDMFHRCAFDLCQSHTWFPGYRTANELCRHMSLHRCQWLRCVSLRPSGGSLSQRSEEGVDEVANDSASNFYEFQPCDYLPLDENDLMHHLDEHLEKDTIPFLRVRGRKVFLCPWETCSSDAYSQRGAKNRNHLCEHIRRHALGPINGQHNIRTRNWPIMRRSSVHSTQSSQSGLSSDLSVENGARISTLSSFEDVQKCNSPLMANISTSRNKQAETKQWQIGAGLPTPVTPVSSNMHLGQSSPSVGVDCPPHIRIPSIKFLLAP